MTEREYADYLSYHCERFPIFSKPLMDRDVTIWFKSHFSKLPLADCKDGTDSMLRYGNHPDAFSLDNFPVKVQRHCEMLARARGEVPERNQQQAEFAQAASRAEKPEDWQSCSAALKRLLAETHRQRERGASNPHREALLTLRKTDEFWK